MKTLQPQKTYFEKLEAVVSTPEKLADIHADTLVPPDISRWMGRLKLLYGMPFNYLVPDQRMLPVESIRFFQLDLNWIYSMVEGAFSIGRSTSGDLAHDSAVIAKVHASSTFASRQLRAATLQSSTTTEHVTGFLLRSAVVDGWPGLEVEAFDKDDNKLTPVLRMERLAPSILLFMVEGVIASVNIHEPPEGLHFGVDLTGNKTLRYVTVPSAAPQGTQPGDPIIGVTAGAVPYRSKRVIKINELAQNIQNTLISSAVDANNDPDTGAPRLFTSAEFALEMVEGVQEVRFVNQS